MLDGSFAGAREVRVASADASYRLYVVPARQIRDFRMHKHMSKPGIYMMLGDPTNKKPEVYIGQAKRRKNGNGTIQRVIEHIDRGEHLFCQWAIMLVDSPRKFGPTELTNLENTFTLAAQEADLTRVRNGCEPSNSELTLATRLRLDKVVETTRLMLGALGIFILDPHPDGGSAEKETQLGNAGDAQVSSASAAVSVPEGEPELVLYMALRSAEEPAVAHKMSDKVWVLKAGSPVNPTPHERHWACPAREVCRADPRRPHHCGPRVHILQHCRYLRGRFQPQRQRHLAHQRRHPPQRPRLAGQRHSCWTQPKPVPESCHKRRFGVT